MNRLTTRTLTTLTATAALAVAGMSPASAARWSHQDAVGDVVSYTSDESNGTESGPDPAPANTNTDITNFTANHSVRRVVLRATLRDITTTSGWMVYEIRTGTRGYQVTQRLGGTNPDKAFEIWRFTDERVNCSGVRHSVDLTTEQAMVSIPRRCLGRPRWVRVGAGALKFKETQTTSTVRFDDALKVGGDLDGDLGRSPRIRHGA